MITKTSPLITAVFWGSIFLIPLIALEVVNRWNFNENFPFALFIFAWILQISFILILQPVLQTLRSKKSVKQQPILFLLQIAGLLLLAFIWSNWIIDQWPCLMGVPQCD